MNQIDNTTTITITTTTSKTFFGFALADSMIPVGIMKKDLLDVEQVRALVKEGVVSVCNPSHEATIAAMRQRYALNVAIPEKAPQVALHQGDRLVVMGVRGLPRLEGRHEYTPEEIEKATFAFSLYTCL